MERIISQDIKDVTPDETLNVWKVMMIYARCMNIEKAATKIFIPEEDLKIEMGPNNVLFGFRQKRNRDGGKSILRADILGQK